MHLIYAADLKSRQHSQDKKNIGRLLRAKSNPIWTDVVTRGWTGGRGYGDKVGGIGGGGGGIGLRGRGAGVEGAGSGDREGGESGNIRAGKLIFLNRKFR